MLKLTRWHFIAATAVAGAMVLGCADREREQYLDPQRAPVGAGWVDLFNGTDLTGWHKRPGHDRPMSWRVEDGLLVNQSGPDTHGVDLVSDPKFDDFEIYYEYQIPAGSNSGVYLRGRYEIQILDDYGHDPAPHTNGALYSKCAPSRNVSRPPGEWQSVYATIVGTTVNVWLNGVKVVTDCVLDAQTGGALDENYDQPGPVMIQGDHGDIKVRHIRVRPIGN